MNDHEPKAVKVNDIIIDEESGEVLDLPENAGDLIELLTYRLTTLQEAERAYKQAIVLLKLALKRELERLDLKSLQTQYGRPSIRSRTTRTGKVERLPGAIQDFELNETDTEAILLCASNLDASELEALADLSPSLRPAIEALIEETVSEEWVQVAPILKPPPVVEKV